MPATMSLPELQEKKLTLIAAMRELGEIEAAEWNEETEARWNQINQDYDENNQLLEEGLKADEQRKARITRLKEVDDALATGSRTQLERTFPNPGSRSAEAILASREQRSGKALKAYLRSQNNLPITEEDRQAALDLGVDITPGAVIDLQLDQYHAIRGLGAFSSTAGGLVRTEFDRIFALEQRTLGVLNPPAGEITGGWQTVPTGFQRELEQAMLYFGGLRRVMRILRTNGYGDLEWPTSNDTDNKGEWLNEAQASSEVDPSFDQVVFKAYKAGSGVILVSAELLDDNGVSLASVVAGMTGERIGRAIAERLATGTGTNQLQGIVNCPEGVTAASNSTIDSDELIDLQHSVDIAYRDNPAAAWAMHDLTVAAIRKIQAGTPENYLWQPGLVLGQPDRILGKPYTVSNELPQIGSNNKSVFFGDMSRFVLREHAQFRLYRMEEKYRDKDLTGWVAFQRVDSRLLDAGTGPIKHLVHPA